MEYLNKGTPYELTRIKPLLLTDPNIVWIVSKGKVDVYLSRIEKGESYGIRTYLFSVEQGELLFSTPTENLDLEYSMVVCAVLDTVLIKTNKVDFYEIAFKQENRIQTAFLINNWIISATRGINKTLPPKNSQVVTAGTDTSITINTCIIPYTDVLWINHNEGISHFVDEEEFELSKSNEFFPLSLYSQIKCKENCTIDLLETEEYMTYDSFFLSLIHYNELLLKISVMNAENQIIAEKQHFEKKHKNDSSYFDKALIHLGSVINTTEDTLVEDETISDDLSSMLFFKACKLVGKSSDIKIVMPTYAKEDGFLKNPLEDIAKASRIRYRQISLKGDWWKKDSGSMLAWLEDTNEPVALIQTSPTSYELHNPASAQKIAVNHEVAKKIKPSVVSFYKPFPLKAINLTELLKFGIKSTWKKDIITVLLLVCAGGFMQILLPIVTGTMFDSIIPEGQKNQIPQVAVFLISGAIAGCLFQFTRSIAMLRLEGKMNLSIESAVWDRILDLPVPFFKDYSSGDLAMRAMSIGNIRKILSGVISTTVIYGIFAIFNFALLFYYDVSLALIVSLMVMFAVLFTLGLGYLQKRSNTELVQITNKITGLLLEIIGGISKFKVSGSEKRAFYLWSKDFSLQRRISFKVASISNLLTVFNSIYPATTTVVLFFMLVNSTKTGLSPGNFIAFNTAFSTLLSSMLYMSGGFISLFGIIPLYNNVKPILETLPEYDESKIDPGEINGLIEVSNADFRYTPSSPLILRNVCINIKPGEFVALVGSSGSGKTTLLRVLLGFETLDSGRIYYDNYDLENIDLRKLRKQLGVVLQNGQLMTGDIFTNIIGANPKLTIKDAWNAAILAGLEEDIKAMPMGMHTVISEGASTFSGGQRQRLLIARAIANKPRILFFDEATSALDNRTQAIISESLCKLNSTRIVIAHRLSTIMNCHRIIVMDKGEVVETGTYEELMNKDGIFAELAKRQLS